MLTPRQKTPDLILPTVNGETFELSNETSERGTVVCFYRGLHCPICATYLSELERLTPDFNKRGVTTIAISSDDKERAGEMAKRVQAKTLRIGYNLSLEHARKWGLIFLRRVAKLRLVLKSRSYFQNLVCLLSHQNRIFIMVPFKLCPLFGLISLNCLVQSILRLKRIILQEVNTLVMFNFY